MGYAGATEESGLFFEKSNQVVDDDAGEEVSRCKTAHQAEQGHVLVVLEGQADVAKEQEKRH